MSKRWKKVSSMLVAAALTVPMALTGCGSKKSAGDDTKFTWWIYSGADSAFYTEYTENPALQYTLTKTWGEDDKKLEFEFWCPATGTADDNYMTMIASGELPDIIDATICDPPQIMYEKGYALDITEYVEKYMPNYVELVHSNDQIYNTCVTLVDGEEKYYALRNIYDKETEVEWGEMYRRDWIVKYGTNPETGEAFTGGYTDAEDPDSWEDDVVFPSGEKDPVYISDWEWMFDIFAKAQEDLGIKDSYVTSMSYPGFNWSGGLLSCFGGGTCVWYEDAEGKVRFGGDSEQFRAYLECLNSWYEKGWLDPAFNERTSDMFFAIDDTTVRQGKVGLWLGTKGELGGRLDAKDGGLTDGIYVAGCAYPINDVYGTDECKFVEPDCVTGNALAGGGVVITPTAEEKDIAALCSYFDYFYGEEGALIKTLGLSAEQAEEISDNTFYADYNLADGAYTKNEDGTYRKADALINDSGNLREAAGFWKVPGLVLVENVDSGYADSYEASVDSWTKYKNLGFFQGSVTTDSMTTEDSKVCDDCRTKVVEYMTNNAVYFINGEKDIANNSDWEEWSKALQKYDYQKVIDIYQPYIDEHPFR